MADERILTNEEQVRRLIEGAVAWKAKPPLSEQDIDDLLELSAEDDSLGGRFWTGPRLNAAAALGWQRKSGLVAEWFDVHLEDGMAFKRHEVFHHCTEMAERYNSGEYDVIAGGPGKRRRGGIGVIGLVSTMVDGDEVPYA